MESGRRREPAAQGHIVTAVTEHVAVLETCRYLESRGFAVTYLPVDRFGRVTASEVVAALRPDTWLVTLMHSNVRGTHP
jgi:cysteine desulfurase